MRRGVDLRPVQPADIDRLSANLRDQDAAELQALGHESESFHDVIRDSVASSVMCHAIWSPTDEFMGICGLSIVSQSLLGAAAGVPWMLGTPVVPRFGAALNRATRRYNAAMLERAPLLFNYVHAANSVSVAWLQRVGYTLSPSEPYGPRGEPFHRFEQRRV
jgi:hypothetical protein